MNRLTMTVNNNARVTIILLLSLNIWNEQVLGFYWATNTTTTTPVEPVDLDKIPSETDPGNIYMLK